METETDNMKNKCPGPEEISAYFDGELDSSSSDFAHIESCPECTARLEECRKLGNDITAALSASVPANFADSMLTSLKEKRRHEQMASEGNTLYIPFFMKAVAMIAVTAVAAFLLFGRFAARPEKTVAASAAETAKPAVFLGDNKTDSGLSTLQVPGAKVDSSENDSVDIRNLMQVSSDGSSGINPADLAAESVKKRPAVIPSAVEQAWSVDNAVAAQKRFAELAPVSAKFAVNGLGNTVMTANMTRKQLAEFVRKCKNAGFRLISPVQPQPEQTTFTGSGDAPVSYRAVIVEP